MNWRQKQMNQFLLTTLVFFSTLAISAAAKAGDRAGNGGDAVLCEDQGGVQAYVADYFEMENLTVLNNYLYSIEGDYTVKVQKVIDRMYEFNLAFANELQANFDLFKSSHAKPNNSKLIEIDDSDIAHIELKDNCEMVQAAVQVRSPGPLQAKFLIQEEIWTMMDSTQRAGLVLHEIVYMAFLDHTYKFVDELKTKKSNSNLSRKFVQAISSEKYFKDMDKELFEEIMKEYNSGFKYNFLMPDKYNGTDIKFIYGYIDYKLSEVDTFFNKETYAGVGHNFENLVHVTLIDRYGPFHIQYGEGNYSYLRPWRFKQSAVFNEKSGKLVAFRNSTDRFIETRFGTLSCTRDSAILLNKKEKIVGCAENTASAEGFEFAGAKLNDSFKINKITPEKVNVELSIYSSGGVFSKGYFYQRKKKGEIENLTFIGASGEKVRLEIDWDEINTKNPCSPLQYKAQLVFDQDSGRLDGLDLDFDISGSCIYRMPNEIIKLVPQD